MVGSPGTGGVKENDGNSEEIQNNTKTHGSSNSVREVSPACLVLEREQGCMKTAEACGRSAWGQAHIA